MRLGSRCCGDVTHLPERPLQRSLMVDMPVIVRHQNRGALRLDHRHDQALCRRRLGDLVFDHRHNAAMRYVGIIESPAGRGLL